MHCIRPTSKSTRWVWEKRNSNIIYLLVLAVCFVVSFVYILRLHLISFSERLTIAVFIDMQSSSSKCSINRTLKGPLKKAKKRVCVVCGLGYYWIGIGLGIGLGLGRMRPCHLCSNNPNPLSVCSTNCKYVHTLASTDHGVHKALVNYREKLTELHLVVRDKWILIYGWCYVHNLV